MLQDEEVARKTCARCQADFSITSRDLVFYAKLEVPQPKLCSACREQRRLSFNNERKLYRRSCSVTGEMLVSHFSADVPLPVCRQDYWWSDQWNALSFGREFDFSRPFFPQFGDLFRAIPHPALWTTYASMENSEYTDYAGYSKNCYLISHADYNQDCYYGYGVKECVDCCDIYNVVKCQLCYECIDCYNCYDLKFSQDCLNCSSSCFLKDCVGCSHCFGCQNVRQKEYWIFNEQRTRADYEKFIGDNLLNSHTRLVSRQNRFRDFSLEQPHRSLHMLRTENSLGDQLVNCRNVTQSFEISDMEDGKYCTQLKLGAKDCMDIHQFGNGLELSYECNICGEKSHHLRFCSNSDESSDLTYCSFCMSCHDCFGCAGLRRNRYCILNKQYRQDDYRALCKRIIEHMTSCGEWGEFFPSLLSPFAYNESRAQEIFPLSKEEALAGGFKWRDEEPRLSPDKAAFPPDSIDEVQDLTAAQQFCCEVSGRAYKIIPPELSFYRRIGICLPRRCPEQRYLDRMAKKNTRRLWERRCGSCGGGMLTTFPPQRPEIVYCEPCYLKIIL